MGYSKLSICLWQLSPESVNILTLQQRLIHISTNAIHTLTHANAVTGLHLIDDSPPFNCDSSKYAETTHKIICKEREAPLADTFGAEVHMDVWGGHLFCAVGITSTM